jgi:hypothetical protein
VGYFPNGTRACDDEPQWDFLPDDSFRTDASPNDDLSCPGLGSDSCVCFSMKRSTDGFGEGYLVDDDIGNFTFDFTLT